MDDTLPDSPVDPDAFAALAREHYEGLYRFAWSLAKSESDAADLVQQTFLILARKGGALRDPSKAKSWLFTTLYREFLRVRRRATPFTSMEEETLEYAAEPDAPDFDRAVDGQDAVEALAAVDEVFRAPLTLFYLRNMSYREIADSLGVPLGTVMSRLSRGKAQLKDRLRRRQREATAARLARRPGEEASHA